MSQRPKLLPSRYATLVVPLALALALALAPCDVAMAEQDVSDPVLPAVDTTVLTRLEDLDSRADDLLHRGSYAPAMELAREAALARGELFGPQSAERARGVLRMAVIARQWEHYGEAQSLFEAAAALFLTVGDEDAASSSQIATAECATYVAILELLAQGRQPEAVPLLRALLAAGEARLEPQHIDLAQTVHDFAYVLETIGQSEEAFDLYKRSRALRLATLPPEHPRLVESWLGMTSLYGGLGYYDEARGAYNEAWTLNREAGGEDLISYWQMVDAPSGVRAVYGADELLALDGFGEPWEEHELRPVEYARWWRAQRPVADLPFARGVRGQVLLRGVVGVSGGPRAVYYMRFTPTEESWDETDEELSNVHLGSSPGGDFGVGVGWGVAPGLELASSVAASPCHYVAEAQIGSDYASDRASPLSWRFGVGVRLSAFRLRRLRPVIGLGVVAWLGPGLDTVFEDFGANVEVMRGFHVVGFEGGPGLVFRLTPRLDLHLDVAARKAVAGSIWIHDRDSPVAVYSEGRFEDLYPAAQLGLQYRFGPFGG